MTIERTALVTGASRGIGRATALELGRAGLRVLGTATTRDGAAAIDALLAQERIAGGGFVLRAEDPDSVSALVTTLGENDSLPDVLVNNAGITRDGLLMRMSQDDWDAVMATNLGALFHLARACIRPMMKKRWGRIIGVASVTAQTGNPGQCNYTSAKAGMIGFCKSLARELGMRNITVNCVAPGFIETDMTAGLPGKHRDEMLQRIPLGRFGQPGEVAGLIRFLASDEAAYVTGETVNVNGGMYMA